MPKAVTTMPTNPTDAQGRDDILARLILAAGATPKKYISDPRDPSTLRSWGGRRVVVLYE